MKQGPKTLCRDFFRCIPAAMLIAVTDFFRTEPKRNSRSCLSSFTNP